MASLKPELLIRAGLGDHKVLADLLAPTPVGSARPIDRLVLSAQDVARSEDLREVAQRSGVPLVVDPLTMLLQDELDSRDAWARHVSFGRSGALAPRALENVFLLDDLVAHVVEFQVEHGATTIVPPYFYADRADSPAFTASVAAIGRTARRMRKEGVHLPLMPLLCAQVQGFARRAGWRSALDRFASAAIDVGPQAIGLYFSPVGDGKESYAKLLDVTLAARHVRSAGAPVIAWRQGAYGEALVAAGLDGYECGMGVGEQANVRGYVNARKPRSEEGTPFVAQGVYFPNLQRSLVPKVARILLDDRKLRGCLVCDSIRCCPRGAESMLASKGRPHAVRARVRSLRELAELPTTAWRLNHVAKRAASAYVTATKANEILATTDLQNRVRTEGYVALEQVAEFLRLQDAGGARDSA